MGARWAWHARCEDGHWNSGFSGGSDGVCLELVGASPYTCGKPLVFETQCSAWMQGGGAEGDDKSCEEEGCFTEPPSKKEIEQEEIKRIMIKLAAKFGPVVHALPIEIALVIVR